MMTTLALAALTLAPAQAGDFGLANVRMTYGLLGLPRTDARFLPGDQLYLAFDLEGVQPDRDGKVKYGIGMEVLDSKGKVVFRQAPGKLEAIPALGGTTLPAFAHLHVGLEQPPGEYTLKVSVTDHTAKATREIVRQIELLKKGFGLVGLSLTGDAEGQIPMPHVGVGQSVWVNFAAVGFERKGGQPNLSATLRVLDKDGKPTMAKPFTGEVTKDIPAKLQAVPMQFLLQLNRAGEFTVELKLTDDVSGKTAKQTFPLNVLKAR